MRGALLAVLISVGLIALGPARAGDPTSEDSPSHAERPPLEAAPFAGLSLGGQFELANSQETVHLSDHGAFGVALGLWTDNASEYELFYSRESSAVHGTGVPPTGIKVEYVHIAGTAVFDQDFPLKPYVIGGLGATRITPDAGSDDTRFSASLGAGVRVPLATRLSMRLEARGFLTFLSSDSALFCHSGESGGACQLRASGSLFFQVQLLAGVAYTF